MKKTLFFALPLLWLCGCVPIPYGYELRKDPYHGGEKVIGGRKDEAGNVVETVVHRKMVLKMYVVGLTPEGLCVKTGWYYSRYALDTADGRKNIWQIAHFPMLPDGPIDSACPVAGSDRWLFDKEWIRHDNPNQVDLRLVLYSPKEGVIWDRTFRRCHNDGPWRFNDDGRTAVVNALSGEIRLPLLPESAVPK
jgi:hypothetical protein